jgi:hypothetical protein
MTAALPLGVSLPVVDPHASAANAANISNSSNSTTIDHTMAHQTNTTSENQGLSNDVDAFYSVGNNSPDIAYQPAMMNTLDQQKLHHSEASSAFQEGHRSDGSHGGAGGIEESKGTDNYTNFSNLFTESANFLQKKGGPSDPLAMFQLQAQMIEVTLNWSVYGQIASKAVSGIQSLFNNQV